MDALTYLWSFLRLNRKNKITRQVTLTANSNDEFERKLEECHSPASVTHLRLNNNKSITSAPEVLGAFVNLVELDLSNHAIDDLCSSWCSIRLKNLRILNLSNNNLKNPYNFLWEYIELQELYLGNNAIEDVCWVVEILKKLRILDLSYNKLRCLPWQIGRLSELRSLNLRGNCLITLPVHLIALKKLEFLDVCENECIRSPTVSDCEQGKDSILKALRKPTDVWADSRLYYQERYRQLALVGLCMDLLLKRDLNYLNDPNKQHGLSSV